MSTDDVDRVPVGWRVRRAEPATFGGLLQSCSTLGLTLGLLRSECWMQSLHWKFSV